jgi:MoaA/NifB/PqqE/SkfB family radical SAM enzyme
MARKASNILHGWQTANVHSTYDSLRRFEGQYCGKCERFETCRKKEIKNAKEHTDYCLWEKNYFKERKL